MNWRFFNDTSQHQAFSTEFETLREAILKRPQTYEILVDTDRLLLYWFRRDQYAERIFAGYVREDMLDG